MGDVLEELGLLGIHGLGPGPRGLRLGVCFLRQTPRPLGLGMCLFCQVPGLLGLCVLLLGLLALALGFGLLLGELCGAFVHLLLEGRGGLLPGLDGLGLRLDLSCLRLAESSADQGVAAGEDEAEDPFPEEIDWADPGRSFAVRV